jgi:hypothetical protein
MTIVPVMWGTWGLLVLVSAVLYLYRSTLTRDEEDQIFLDDSFNHEKTAQAAIMEKVHRIEPAVSVSKWLVAAATLFVVAYYIWDIFTKFK